VTDKRLQNAHHLGIGLPAWAGSKVHHAFGPLAIPAFESAPRTPPVPPASKPSGYSNPPAKKFGGSRIDADTRITDWER